MTAPPPRAFDVVAFDLDGTLADTSGDLAAALNHALARLGRPALDLAEVRSMVGHGTRALMRKGLAATGDADDALVDRSLPDLIDFYTDNIRRMTRPAPGAEGALDALRASGVRTAICTNKPERLTRKLIDTLGWSERFDAIIGGDNLPVQKPDPAPLREAVARAGGGRAVFIGDSMIDALTARAADMPFVAVTFGFRDRPVAEFGADAIIDHFDALADTLARLPPCAAQSRSGSVSRVSCQTHQS